MANELSAWDRAKEYMRAQIRPEIGIYMKSSSELHTETFLNIGYFSRIAYSKFHPDIPAYLSAKQEIIPIQERLKELSRDQTTLEGRIASEDKQKNNFNSSPDEISLKQNNNQVELAAVKNKIADLTTKVTDLKNTISIRSHFVTQPIESKMQNYQEASKDKNISSLSMFDPIKLLNPAAPFYIAVEMIKFTLGTVTDMAFKKDNSSINKKVGRLSRRATASLIKSESLTKNALENSSLSSTIKKPTSTEKDEIKQNKVSTVKELDANEKGEEPRNKFPNKLYEYIKKNTQDFYAKLKSKEAREKFTNKSHEYIKKGIQYLFLPIELPLIIGVKLPSTMIDYARIGYQKLKEGFHNANMMNSVSTSFSSTFSKLNNLMPTQRDKEEQSSLNDPAKPEELNNVADYRDTPPVGNRISTPLHSAKSAQTKPLAGTSNSSEKRNSIS